MQGHRRFLANDRGTVSATARPALSGFGLQWAWRRFYQIDLSPGPLQVAASRVLAWSQLARQKEGCLVRAQAVLPNHLMNTPRKLLTGIDPARPRPRQTGSSQTGHHPITQHTGAEADGLDQVAFPDTALSHPDQVLPAADELAPSQRLDPHSIDDLGIELPIEVGQGLVLGEPGRADALGETPLAASVGLLVDQGPQEFQVRHPLALSTP